MSRLAIPFVLAAAAFSAAAFSTAPSSDDDLRRALGDDAVAPRWIYDDWAAAVERAIATKRPIFAVFRCVP